MSSDQPVHEESWVSRNMRPVIVLYVAYVFIAFMLGAHFLFHSPDAVKALFFTFFGAVFSMAPALLSKTEYRLSESGLEKRRRTGDDPKPFKNVFAWDELDHVIPTASGFKFHKQLDESNPILRFWKLHVTDAYSGEFHVEGRDRPRVREELARRGIPLSRPPASRQVEPNS